MPTIKQNCETLVSDRQNAVQQIVEWLLSQGFTPYSETNVRHYSLNTGLGVTLTVMFLRYHCEITVVFDKVFLEEENGVCVDEINDYLYPYGYREKLSGYETIKAFLEDRIEGIISKM